MTLSTRLVIPAIVLVLLGASACASDPASAPPVSGDTSSEAAAPADEASTSSSALDADGFVVPGEVVELQLGDSVSYYSYPKLSQDDAQKVTIHSFEYIDKADVGPDAPLDKIDTDGVLVISLTWESVLGQVQSNQGYLKAELDTGEAGRNFAYRGDRIKNGRVEAGAPKTGTFTIGINRGATTLTVVDYTEVPVARLTIDTGR